MEAFTLGIIYFFLSLGYVFPIGFILFCLWRSFSRFSEGNPSGAGLWLLAACSPILLFVINTTLFDARVASRKAAIANLERTKISGEHPSTLLLQGYLMDTELAVLLLRYDFSQIYSLYDRSFNGRRRATLIKATPTPQCIEAADVWLDNYKKRQDYQNDAVLQSCVTRSAAEFDDNALPDHAVVFLMDLATTERRGNTSSGNYEVRLRSDGADRLVDYWERPVGERQLSPLCLPNSPMCGSSDFKKLQHVDRFKFLVRALGHA